MNGPLESLKADIEMVSAAWAEAQPAFDEQSAGRRLLGTQAEVERMSDAGLLRATDATARLLRDGEALLALLAGEVARRSPRAAGKDGLAKKQGFLNPVRLVAASTGGALAGAARLISVGAATAERQSLSGDRLPPRHPHLAAASRTGAVSVEAAAAITGMLDRVVSRADAQHADRVEKLLARQAADLPLELLMRVIRGAEARLDPDGVRPREDELRADRALSFREDARSMLHVTAVLDPETGAPVKAAIEATVTHSIRARRGSVGGTGRDGPDAAPAVIDDDRTIPQMQADAMAMIARHAIGCARMPDAPAMAVVVRTELETLVAGVGHGQLDGLDQPVSAGMMRKLAASAGIIPAVLGERDGGCACCGMQLSYAEAHHIRWWERDTGPTDLNNGVLLCPPCHTRVHDDGWGIRVRDGQVWFIPPPYVDPHQEPRVGGNARFGPPGGQDVDAA
jgi:Domain of unknown function DUF222./HNH endonuclease.